MPRDLHRVSWNHPDKGRLSEVLCPRHRRHLLAIFDTLNIGCVGEPTSEGVCFPCAHDDLLDALRSLVADSGPHVTDPVPPLAPVRYDRDVLATVLIYHGRTSIKGCHCGWAKPGASHPEHVADVYEESVRLREQR